MNARISRYRSFSFLQHLPLLAAISPFLFIIYRKSACPSDRALVYYAPAIKTLRLSPRMHTRHLTGRPRMLRNHSSRLASDLVDEVNYESPFEDNHPPFFQPSEVQATCHHTSTSDDARARHCIRNNTALDSDPNYALPISETSSTSHKVSISDRIACHRWTYFTMVSVDKSHKQVEDSLINLQDHVYWWNGQCSLLL